MVDIISRKDLGKRGAFDVIAEIFLDTDSSTSDADCYSEEDVRAWRNNDWEFVTIRVAASIKGHTYGVAYIGGTEHGTLGDGREIDALSGGAFDYYGEELIAEAVKEATEAVNDLLSFYSPGL